MGRLQKSKPINPAQSSSSSGDKSSENIPFDRGNWYTRVSSPHMAHDRRRQDYQRNRTSAETFHNLLPHYGPRQSTTTLRR